MRIGLDAHILGKGKGGVERVVHQMVRLLPGIMPECEFVVFTKKNYTPPFGHRPNVRYRRLPVDDPLLQRSLVLPWLARRERLDLLHVQRAAPPCIRARLIVHTHDLLPLTAPADHQGFRDQLVRRLMPGSIRRADGVLTVSESVAAEIRRHFPHASGKLLAIPNGIDADFFRPKPAGERRAAIHARLKLTGDYVLYLGALMARKNLEVAIRGFGEYLRDPLLPASARNTKLVLAGMSRSKEYAARLQALAEKLAPGAILFTGFISDEDCLALLQHAAVFLAPSRGEGFDLPALEAMACGIPVLCSDIPVHRELLGNDARFFPTHQPGRLALELQRLMTRADWRGQLAQQGPARVAGFTWESAMQRLSEFYRKILSGHQTAVPTS
ncbi:MAG TPA: glycosyltransferase family 1 protein [Opitutaceae bacterium]|jgi:glycosyltransferase involved in cell wall biosynthesis|nr:glycosyltransferase family 1 protein [Opitutaceae bacterium]